MVLENMTTYYNLRRLPIDSSVTGLAGPAVLPSTVWGQRKQLTGEGQVPPKPPW